MSTLPWNDNPVSRDGGRTLGSSLTTTMPSNHLPSINSWGAKSIGGPSAETQAWRAQKRREAWDPSWETMVKRGSDFISKYKGDNPPMRGTVYSDGTNYTGRQFTAPTNHWDSSAQSVAAVPIPPSYIKNPSGTVLRNWGVEGENPLTSVRNGTQDLMNPDDIMEFWGIQ